MRYSKFKTAVLLLLIFYAVNHNSVYAAINQASIPKITINLNGITAKNEALKTPVLLAKSMYYLPITAENSSILGIQMIKGENERFGEHAQVVFIGTGDEKSSRIHQLSGVKRKNSSTVAVSPVKGFVFLNSIDTYTDNTKESFPLLQYKNTYYLPLSGHISSELLNWQVTSGKGVLKIDSRESVRPVQDGSTVLSTSIGAGGYSKRYVFSNDTYVGYPVSTMNMQYEFVYKKRAGQAVVFSLQDELSDADYYLNTMINSSGAIEHNKNNLEKLERDVLTLPCLKIYGKDNQTVRENYLLVIDLIKHKIIEKRLLTVEKSKL